MKVGQKRLSFGKTLYKLKAILITKIYKTETVISSVIEMLQLANFGHMIISVIKFEPRDKILLVNQFKKYYNVKAFIKNCKYFNQI